MNSKRLNTLLAIAALAWTGCKGSNETMATSPEQPTAKAADHGEAAKQPGEAREAPTAAVAASAGGKVETYGALHAIFHEGQTGPQVALASVAKPTLHAVGALSEGRGEITAVDGTFWLAYPEGENGTRVESVQQSDEKAMLLVTANVAAWRRVPIEEDIANADIDARLEALLTANGADVTQAIPLRIEGPLASVEWHVLDASKAGDQPAHSHEDHQRASVRGTVPETEGTLVGFFSKQHQGVFTHMGSNSHFHVVLAKEKISGHVDGVVIKKGATLLLPQ